MGEFCIPKIQKRVVCKVGEKCFHDRHFTDECEAFLPFPPDLPTFTPVAPISSDSVSRRIGARQGLLVPIPADACVIAPPQVINLGEQVEGQVNGCIRILVSYRIVTVLQSLSTGEVCIATIEVIDLPLNVPVQDVNTDPLNPLVLCKEPFYEEVFKKRPLNAYDARVVPSPVNPGFGRLVVRVEKLFIAVKYSENALVCEQGCAVQDCVPQFPPLPECPPFVAPTQCPEFCFQDDENPLFQCTDCPPVQTTNEPPEVCLVPEVGALEEFLPGDGELGPQGFEARTPGVVITVRRGAQTFAATTDSSQLARYPLLRGGFLPGDVITARGKSVTIPPRVRCCRVDFVARVRQGVIVQTLVFCDGRLLATLPN